MKLRWLTLTPKQRTFFLAHIANGCKGKGSLLNPPDFIFMASCNHHDFNYWIGHTGKDRKKADRQFYKAMLIDANEHPWYKRCVYKSLAWVYYQAVRLFASSYFYYADQERTEEDLEKLMEERYA